MKIGIEVSEDDFLYDVHSLVKSFFPEDDVAVFTSADAEKKAVPRNMLIRVRIPEYTDRPAAKNALKRDLYRTLVEYTGHGLPWGTLTGIRPTKIPMKMLREGKDTDTCAAFLMSENFVSEKKARLASEIASYEKQLTDPIGLDEHSFSLYVHIPFCPTVCGYCTFSSSPESVWKKYGAEYLKTLFREMDRRKREDTPTTVYIGGGTPTVMDADALDSLLGGIEARWNLTGIREYTVEAGRPDSITREKLAVMRKHGVTRISVNPQTMNDETLRRIGRSHTAEDVREAFSLAREAGFDNINMDIIVGLPGEEKEELLHTLSEIRRLDPDSLTVHSLAVKRASRLRYEILTDRMADSGADRENFRGLSFSNDEERMEMAAACAAEMGMRPYYLYRQKNMRGNLENVGYARSGRACLYNILIMEEMESIEAFGAGASTKYVFPGGRIERSISPKDIRTYLARNA